MSSLQPSSFVRSRRPLLRPNLLSRRASRAGPDKAGPKRRREAAWPFPARAWCYHSSAFAALPGNILMRQRPQPGNISDEAMRTDAFIPALSLVAWCAPAASRVPLACIMGSAPPWTAPVAALPPPEAPAIQGPGRGADPKRVGRRDVSTALWRAEVQSKGRQAGVTTLGQRPPSFTMATSIPHSHPV